MRTIKARYPGDCAACGGNFPKGALILYDRQAPRMKKARHADCGAADDDNDVIEIRTSTGTYDQRRGGRCEDAPCCGCCTF